MKVRQVPSSWDMPGCSGVLPGKQAPVQVLVFVTGAEHLAQSEPATAASLTLQGVGFLSVQVLVGGTWVASSIWLSSCTRLTLPRILTSSCVCSVEHCNATPRCLGFQFHRGDQVAKGRGREGKVPGEM